MYFNSQPHKEADVSKQEFDEVIGISTHSLTRRLTCFIPSIHNAWIFQLTASQGGWRFMLLLRHLWMKYFNSQPHKEADLWTHNLSNLVETFQLTASQGGWRNSKSRWNWTENISTHSLTRRLTVICILYPGCRIFQLTASQGGWPPITFAVLSFLYFNSQPHKEADIIGLYEGRKQDISTHSLTRRLTIYGKDNVYVFDISTHSLTRRLTIFS